MTLIFDVAQMAEDDAIRVRLRDGREIATRDLLPEVVDRLGQVVDKRAQEDARNEVEQRRLMRILQNEDASDEDYAQASAELTQLTTKAAQRGRQLVYEQLATVLADENGKALTVRQVSDQVPLPVAQRIAEALSRQILGQQDGDGSAEGNSPTVPTPNGSTPPERG